MVKLLSLFIILILGNNILLFSDEIPTLNEIMSSYKYTYMRDSPLGGIKEFPELQIKILSYSEGNTFPLLLAGFYDNQIVGIFGVVYGNSTEHYYFYDFNGDGIFEYNANMQYFIAPWITHKINLPRNYPNKFFEICDELYFMHNSIEGVNNQKLTEILTEIINMINNVNEYNRDIYYSFIQYFLYYNQHPGISLNIMLGLADHLIQISDKLVPLLVLYIGEALIKTGNDEKALPFFSLLKEMDNNSIVAGYYIAKLNDQKENTTKNIEEFKNNFPNFWMVR